jgi:nucleoside-diphosphate-sugar epimerase
MRRILLPGSMLNEFGRIVDRDIAAGARRPTLVTGGAGFIGHHLSEFLVRQGHQVSVIDDLSEQPLLPLMPYHVGAPVESLSANDLAGVDTVFHLASIKSVPQSFVRPRSYLRNIDAMRHLSDLCAAAGVRRLVVASSCEIYGVDDELPSKETHALSPRSPYAQSKVAIEAICKMMQADPRSRTDCTIVRLFNVYGPGERADALIPAFCRNALLEGSITIEGTGRQRRDFSHISDVVPRLAAIAAVSRLPVVNLGSGRSTSVLRIAEIIQSLMPGVKVRHAEARPMEIAEFLADVSLANRVLPRPGRLTDIRDGARATFDWWDATLRAGRSGRPGRADEVSRAVT